SPLADPRPRRRTQGAPRRAGGRRGRAGAGGKPGRTPGALAAVRVQHHPSAPGRTTGRPAVRRGHPDRPRPRLPGGHGLAPQDAPGPVETDRSEEWAKGQPRTLDVSRRTAEVVVIGAGVMGASVAYHLARRGCRNVLVLERFDRPGLGSTGKATGGFRSQFTTDVYVRLSLAARDRLERFREELGVDPGYQPVGYLFMARTAAQLEALRAAMAVQRAAGLRDVREVGPDDIRRLSPAVRADDLIGGTFGPTDGDIVPLKIMRGFTEAAPRLGVQFGYDAGWVECVAES